MVGPASTQLAETISGARNSHVVAVRGPWMDRFSRRGTVLLSCNKAMPSIGPGHLIAGNNAPRAKERMSEQLVGLIRSFKTIWTRATTVVTNVELGKPDQKYHPDYELGPKSKTSVLPTRERPTLLHHNLALAAGTGGGLGEPHVA
ncbi:MAG: hypothetical protein ACR2PG_11460 [Hyphomicrobiaceae bacterium]